MNVIIIGGGQVGAYIANILLKNNDSVRVIEHQKSTITKLLRDLPPEVIIFGNGTDPNILESAGIAKADVVAAVSGADETNLVASTIAKFEFNVPRVIARVNNPRNAWLFDSSMGVDVGLNQADLMAHLAVEEIDFKNMLTLMKINHGNYSIVQVKVDPQAEAVNKTIRELALPEQAVFIAVYRGDKVVIPHGDTIFLGGDQVLAFADGDSQLILNKIFNAKS